MHEDTAIWSRKGATLSDKSARQEFGESSRSIGRPKTWLSNVHRVEPSMT
jgi:hypothetical protein